MSTTTVSFLVDHFSDVISVFALAVSFLALGWNIVRDVFTDRVKLDIQVTIGGVMNYASGSGRGFFRDADPTYIPEKPMVGVLITNVGRRTIVVSKIYGNYKDKNQVNSKFILGAEHIPKALQPYETVMEVLDARRFISEIQNDLIAGIYVQDTKGRSWPLSKKSFARLRRTANLVPRLTP